MQKTLTLLLVAGLLHPSSAQQSKNMNLLGNLQYSQSLSDVWGYVDASGNEYAIVGVRNGVSIVNVTNPANPQEIFFAPGPSSTWRDMKTWNKHAYITNESNNGLMIIDLSNLPSLTPAPTVKNDTNFFKTAHNIYIDGNGTAYIFGANTGGGGAIMLDLTGNPKVPVYLGNFGTYYLHDGMVRGDTLWGAAIYGGFLAAIDVSDPANPVETGRATTPGAFAHNAWVSDDGNYVFTTDEITNAFIGAFDVSDLGNITMVDKIQSNPGTGTIVHNTHYINGYIVTSYYRDGTTIHDVSRPSNMVEVGYYDSSPAQSGNGFNGAWGAYPWLPSGNILESNIENGLHIYGPTYKRGCYLEGIVTDTVTTAPINNVYVELLTTVVTDYSDLTGSYAVGIVDPGTYSVSFSEPKYFPKTITGVSLSNGNLTTLNVRLVPRKSFVFSGKVVEKSTGNPIPGASVKIVNQDFLHDVLTDGSGNFTASPFYAGTYTINGGKWGYITGCFDMAIDSVNNYATLQLETGIYDDFTFDFGWAVSGNASAGQWEAGEPVGTSYGADASNPDADVETDCHDWALVTGNGGGSAGTDDVDNGTTVATSPVFDGTTMSSPYLTYYCWFFNAGGSTAPDDELLTRISNGSTTVTVDLVNDNSTMSEWVGKQIRIKDYITPTANMRVLFVTGDSSGSGGHIVEAGIDRFQIVDSVLVAVNNVGSAEEAELTAWPNPSSGAVTFGYSLNAHPVNAKVVVRDMVGRTMETTALAGASGSATLGAGLPAGVYTAGLYNDGRLLGSVRLVKVN